MYRKIKTYQLNLAELYENNKLATQNIIEHFKLDNKTSVKELAADIRFFLGIDMAKQQVWDSADAAIKAWRDVLFEKGIFVFKEAFFNDEYSGISVFNEIYPAILINNSMHKNRQIFTIAHELGHLLFHSGGIDVQLETFFKRLAGDYLRIEQKCNEFAGELLFPENEFLALGMSFSEDTVYELANHYKVSREVVLRKYLNTRQIDAILYKKLTDKWAQEFFKQRHGGKTTEGGNHYLTKKAYLGEAYINLAFSRYFQGHISQESLAAYLGEKVKNVSTFEGYALGLRQA
jgi:Zn-dependent peptidase ImmA (M78 family)